MKHVPITIAIDTGGTFTDFIYIRSGEIKILKILSTPDNPGKAVLEGICRIQHESPFPYSIIHGSTVATNALLERKGARTALITTAGFQDLLEIGRQNRPDIYNIFADRPQPLIPAPLRFELNERTLYTGEILQKVSKDDCTTLLRLLKKKKIVSIAVCFLHSYANPANEQTVTRMAQEMGFSVSPSSEILPEYREYERMSTTAINAYVAPIMDAYLDSIERNLPGIGLQVMKSNGGVVSARTARAESVHTILSGPAGGAVGSFAAGKRAGFDNVITFDMGGTSTDVCLCPGILPMTAESIVAGCPIKVPIIDIHTVGAGGGSLAMMDAGGALRVGPESAGAAPGPICYGKGEQLTVTDANLALGRLHKDHFLGGAMPITCERMNKILKETAHCYKLLPIELAAGIIRVVNSNMEKALRVISIERGYNPRDFALVSFGGAGGLHAADLARALNIKTIVIPLHPGIYSAMGMLFSDFIKDYSKTVLIPANADSFETLQERFRPLEELAVREMHAEGILKKRILIQRFVDIRYRGQSYELTVPFSRAFIQSFHQAHKQRYGFSNKTRDTEAVTIRIKCIGKTIHPEITTKPVEKHYSAKSACLGSREVFTENSFERADIYDRMRLRPGMQFSGPAVIHEYSATTYVPKDFSVAVDDYEDIIISVR
jgi:N-methylhydantoinase A